MKTLRPRKKDDLKKSTEAAQLLLDFIKIPTENEIEGNHWIAGMITIIAKSYKNSGLSYEDVINELINIAKYYKSGC